MTFEINEKQLKVPQPNQELQNFYRNMGILLNLRKVVLDQNIVLVQQIFKSLGMSPVTPAARYNENDKNTIIETATKWCELLRKSINKSSNKQLSQQDLDSYLEKKQISANFTQAGLEFGYQNNLLPTKPSALSRAINNQLKSDDIKLIEDSCEYTLLEQNHGNNRIILEAIYTGHFETTNEEPPSKFNESTVSYTRKITLLPNGKQSCRYQNVTAEINDDRLHDKFNSSLMKLKGVKAKKKSIVELDAIKVDDSEEANALMQRYPARYNMEGKQYMFLPPYKKPPFYQRHVRKLLLAGIAASLLLGVAIFVGAMALGAAFGPAAVLGLIIAGVIYAPVNKITADSFDKSIDDDIYQQAKEQEISPMMYKPVQKEIFIDPETELKAANNISDKAPTKVIPGVEEAIENVQRTLLPKETPKDVDDDITSPENPLLEKFPKPKPTTPIPIPVVNKADALEGSGNPYIINSLNSQAETQQKTISDTRDTGPPITPSPTNITLSPSTNSGRTCHAEAGDILDNINPHLITSNVR